MGRKKKEQLVEIGLLLKRNLKDVVDIEKKACSVDDEDFGTMVSEYAWSSTDFINFIRKKNTYAYVIKEGDLVVGFFLLEVHENEVSIERICIDKNYRNSGFGKEVLNFIYKKEYRNKVTHTCREDDMEAINFFKSNDFVGKLSKNHFGEDKDGIKFYKDIP